MAADSRQHSDGHYAATLLCRPAHCCQRAAGGAWKGGAVTFVLKKDRKAHPDSFSIRQEEGKTTLASPTETGLLYAAYHLLRPQQTQSLPADSGTRVWTESPASDNFTCPDATLLNQVR